MDTLNLMLRKLKELRLLPHTQFIILYGSVQKKEHTPLSDVDVCVSLSLSPPERLRARARLQGHLPEKYDIQIFEDLPLYVQKEVLSGTVLYRKNKARLVQRALQVLYDYEDFEPAYLLYIERAAAGT